MPPFEEAWLKETQRLWEINKKMDKYPAISLHLWWKYNTIWIRNTQRDTRRDPLLKGLNTLMVGK